MRINTNDVQIGDHISHQTRNYEITYIEKYDNGVALYLRDFGLLKIYYKDMQQVFRPIIQ